RPVKKDIPAMGLGKIPFAYREDKGGIQPLGDLVDTSLICQGNVLEKRFTTFPIQQYFPFFRYSRRPGKLEAIAFRGSLGHSLFVIKRKINCRLGNGEGTDQKKN